MFLGPGPGPGPSTCFKLYVLGIMSSKVRVRTLQMVVPKFLGVEQRGGWCHRLEIPMSAGAGEAAPKPPSLPYN